MKYIIKKCKKCGIKFNTRPCYNKEHCKKCWNNIRMRKVYRKLHPRARVVYVRGNQKESKKQWAQRNYKKVKEIKHKYRYERGGLEKEKKYCRQYYKKNKKEIAMKAKIYRSNNKEKIAKRSYKYRKENPEKIRKNGQEWYKTNTRKAREACKKYKKKRYKNDIHFRIKVCFSSLINKRLRRRLSSKDNKSTWSFLSYTIDDLIQHLEKQFTKGMTWNNYGKWHIDHIRPDCSFNYKNVDDKEFQKCWALNNLQPLWARDNLKKNGKWLASPKRNK